MSKQSKTTQDTADKTYAHIKRYDSPSKTAVADLIHGDVVMVKVNGTFNQRAVLKDGDKVTFVLPKSGKVAPKGPKAPLAKDKSFEVVGHAEGGWTGIARTPKPKASGKSKAATPKGSGKTAPKAAKPKASKAADMDMSEIVKALRASAAVVSKAADVLDRLS